MIMLAATPSVAHATPKGSGSVHPAAAATTARADLAAGWLDREVSGTTIADDAAPSAYDFPARAVLALEAIGGHDDAVTATTSMLAEHVGSATSSPNGETLSSPSARMVLVAQAAGMDPADIDGTDLISRLEQHVSTYAAMTGRLRDGLHYGDGVDVVAQAQAVRGLAAAGSPMATSMIGFLLQQQCTAGFFRLHLDDPYADHQGCRAGDPSSTPDVGATVQSIMALRDARFSGTPAQRTRIQDAVRSARAWLTSVQRHGGGFAADPTARGARGDTAATGQAEQLLRTSGRPALATRAARWLRHVQLVSGPDAGVLAPTHAAALAARRTGSVPAAARDAFATATALAAPGLLPR